MNERRALRPYLAVMIFAMSAFVLSGCSALSNIFAPHPPEEPAPPFRQPQFADFESYTYLPDRLVIPAIELDTPVVELGWSSNTSPDGRVFSRWDVAEYAAGWHKNDAPLDSSGNVVMSGHNNVLGSVFRELDQLKQGDTAVVMSGNVEYQYTIDSVIIVPDKTATPEQRRDNAKWIAAYPDDRLTLVSCWPRDDNTHRIIVVAHRADADGSPIKAGLAGQ